MQDLRQFSKTYVNHSQKFKKDLKFWKKKSLTSLTNFPDLLQEEQRYYDIISGKSDNIYQALLTYENLEMVLCNCANCCGLNELLDNILLDVKCIESALFSIEFVICILRNYK